MSAVDGVVAGWVAELPPGATAEHVRDGFWFVRLPGEHRSWIPIEIDVGQRSVKLTSYVIIPPRQREADFYRFLLRNNFPAPGVAFAVDPTGLICLVGRIPIHAFDAERLDALVGRVHETTERCFRSLLRIGFGVEGN